ncbi:IS30 family transposase [Spartinivicinus poritis]|uniref:IS30 family transposase n=1 Tax=Spartinivicinus poritis TaxID=2994640 RepID=A0ABT5UHD3_9GAMM|nr:IS30 family transposase [Spartinivicinus sp. A2-2]MDE1465806.1 IS30 family transposase [Spartinivicinus sp. A2-2]
MAETYKQITLEERYQISAYLAAGFSRSAIAEQLGRSKSSISREINRNKGLRGYRPKQAHEKAMERRQMAFKAVKMTPELIHLIETKIREEWSPEQVSGWLLDEHNLQLSHERIYLHIWDKKAQGGDLLRRQGKKYTKRCHSKNSRGQIKNRTSIDERPAIVDAKTRVGDWEIDTVIGKGHQGVLVTLVERKTLYTLVAQVESKQATVVTKAAIDLLMPFKERVHTITADNGKEFAFHEEIAKQLQTKVYFAHPYHSWERGVNENTNGLLRQYFPKNTNLKNITQEQIDAVVYKFNSSPRKTLGYKTPEEMMNRSLARTSHQ